MVPSFTPLGSSHSSPILHECTIRKVAKSSENHAALLCEPSWRSNGSWHGHAHVVQEFGDANVRFGRIAHDDVVAGGKNGRDAVGTAAIAPPVARHALPDQGYDLLGAELRANLITLGYRGPAQHHAVWRLFSPTSRFGQ